MFRIYRRPIVVTWYQTNSLEREIFSNKTTKRSKRKKAQSQRAGKQSKAIESSDCLSPYSGFYTVFFLIFCFLFLQGCFFFFYFVVVVVVSFVVSFLPIHAPNDISDIYISQDPQKQTNTHERARTHSRVAVLVSHLQDCHLPKYVSFLLVSFLFFLLYLFVSLILVFQLRLIVDS